MRISRVHVTNFRAIADAAIDMEGLTCLIGSNNSGKSAFLKAIDLFFSNAPKIDDDDFHAHTFDKPIDITLTLIDLTPDELKLFESNLINGELIVTRQLIRGNPKDSGNFFVAALVNPAFSDCRNEKGKSERRDLYKKLQEKFDLPNVKNADEIDPKLEEWESNKENEKYLKRERVGSFRGWKNVAIGQLKGKTDFILVPAVRDAAQETGEGKSPAKQLIDTIAKQTIENNEAFKTFKAKTDAQLKEFTNPDNVPALAEISGALSVILQQYYAESSLIATWQPITEFPIQFPSAHIAVKDHEFVSSVDRVGHGLQRAVIITVLEYLAKQRYSGATEEEFKQPQSDLLIAIEEPEIYQHPTKQRHFSYVLNELASSFNKHTGIRVQIILATHSPLFVHLARFNEVRIARRKVDEPRNVLISKLTVNECSIALANFHTPPKTPFSESAFAAKLHIFNSEISEGFFAKKIILVEGPSDKAILEAFYRRKSRSCLSEGICIVNVGGKKSLDKPTYIFSSLKIPTYTLMDNDDGATEKEKERAKEVEYNRFLQAVLGVEKKEICDWPKRVSKNWAAWNGNLEKYLIEKCGIEKYNAVKTEMMTSFEVDSDDCVKSPAIASAMFAKFMDEGIKFDELDQMVKAIDAL